MTAVPHHPMQSSTLARIDALTAMAVALAAGGAIALLLNAPPPHGPIAIAVGMHVPLIIALWRAPGIQRGAFGSGIGFSLRALWSILLYVAICAFAMLMLGVAHVLNRGSAFAALAGVGLLLTFWLANNSPCDASQPLVNLRSVWMACPLVLIGAIAATHALLHPLYDVDVLYYHLYMPAQWSQAGHIFIVPTGFGEFAPSYYPYAAELYYLSLMIPMGNDHLARGGQVLFYIELITATVALGREMRLRLWARLVASGCVVLTPALAWQAATANVDLALTAHLVAVALFAIRMARRPSAADAAGLILATGLAVGTKVLAIPYLLALSPLWVRGIASFLRRKRQHSRCRTRNLASMLGATGAAASIGGFWYARNWLVTGNPLYPLKVTLGGITLFDGVFDRAVMINSTFNQSRFGWEGLREVLRELLRVPAWFSTHAAWNASDTSMVGAWLILGAVVATTIFSVCDARFRIRFALPLLPLSILAMIALFWWSIPYQVSRFLWPPLAFSMVTVFAVMSRLPRGAARGAIGLFACAWLVLSWGELVSTFATKIGGAVAAAGITVLWLHLRLVKLRQVVAAGTCIVGVWAALWQVAVEDSPRQANHRHPRWRTFGDAWTWVDAHADGRTLAYAGHNVPYFLMGPGLRNRLLYVQASGEPGWGYHDFARLPTARSLGRPNVTDFAANRLMMDGRTWLRRLAAERVDYVVVSRLYRGPTISHRHDRDAFPLEREWLDTLAQARDADGRRLASRTIFGGGWVLLYRLNLTSDESHWPRLSTIEQHETDALDRRRRDGTPVGEEIAGYPFAAEAIAELRLDVLP